MKDVFEVKIKNGTDKSVLEVTHVHSALSPFLLKDKPVNFNYTISFNIHHLNNSSPADFTVTLRVTVLGS